MRHKTIKRVWHHWEKWECYKSGFYSTSPPDGIDRDSALEMYASFLRNIPRFNAAMERVFTEWPHSCEHFLTNLDINRIAWMGQASMCIETGISSFFRAGFKLLSPLEQRDANHAAEVAIAKWERTRSRQMELQL